MTVANLLSWIESLRDTNRPSWQLLQFSGNGRFNHETDTREALLILVLPRPEEGRACSIFHEGALFGKAYFAESSDTDVQPS